VSPVWRAVAVAPFEMAVMIYLLYLGIIISLSVPAVARELNIEPWPVVTFICQIILGPALTILGRIAERERLESFGLFLVIVACFTASAITLSAGQGPVTLGDDLAIAIGAFWRIRILSKARKAERVAIELSGERTSGESE
jgi:hypothetical protein